MASGQRFMLKLHGDYLSQQWLNVFWYAQTSGAGGASALAMGWNAALPHVIAPMMATSCNMNIVEVINLDNPGDFYQVDAATASGSDIGAPLPAYFATAFMYLRATRLCRNGWKRFCGVTEEMVDGANLASAYVAEAEALAFALETYVSNDGNDFHPKIGRVRMVDDVPVYTLFDLAAVEFSKLSTQNSRKP